MVEVHRAARSQADARHERAATAAAARPGGPPGPECQPNAGAPLLRDERARREWLEHELGLACQARGPPVAPSAARPLRAPRAPRVAAQACPLVLSVLGSHAAHEACLTIHWRNV